MLIGRTVLKEVGRNFAVSLVSTTGVAFFMLSITFLKRTPGVGMGFLVQVFPLFFPLALQFTVPIAALSSVILTFARMHSDGELTALAAAGVAPITVIRPVLAAASVVALVALLLSDSAAPFAAKRLRAAKRNILQELKTSFRSGLSDLDLGNGRLSFEAFEDGDFVDVCVEWNQEGQLHFYRARRGNIAISDDGLVNLTLKDVRGSFPFQTKEGEVHAKGRDIVLQASLDELTGTGGASRRRKDMRAWELAYIGGHGIPDGPGVRVWSAGTMEELARRSALAAAVFCLALVGVPLGIWSSRRGKAGAFLQAMAPIIVLYFPAMLFASNLARSERAPAYLALWGVNAALVIVALVLIRRIVRA
jgi:lipopolysaccharide export system permease protein